MGVTALDNVFSKLDVHVQPSKSVRLPEGEQCTCTYIVAMQCQTHHNTRTSSFTSQVIKDKVCYFRNSLDESHCFKGYGQQNESSEGAAVVKGAFQ